MNGEWVDLLKNIKRLPYQLFRYSEDENFNDKLSFGGEYGKRNRRKCETLQRLVGWLVGWILWPINLCRLFNAKSIFMKIVLFQTIQFSISTQFKSKYSLIVKNISISSYSV